MKTLKDKIFDILCSKINEKLIITKDTKEKYNTYTFINDDHSFSKITINLPFKFYFPEIDEEVEINKIVEEVNDFEAKCWDFFIVQDNQEYKVVRLSAMGVHNVFIKQNTNSKINKVSPLIHHITTGSDHHIKKIHKFFQIELSDPHKTIVDESKIDEKLIITKDTKEKQNIFWFTNNFGIKLPFTLKLCGSHTINVNITEIKQIQKNNDMLVWSLYDDQNRHITNLYHQTKGNSSYYKPSSSLNMLFKYESRTYIGQLFDDEIKKVLSRTNNALIKYDDDEDKILQESINESQDEPKRYSNMILMNPDEDAVLILRRANYMRKFRTMWGFPGGSVDQKDKDSKAAAVRELKEETGIELTFNEECKCKKFDSIKNEDGSISDYWIAILEDEHEVKLSREHSKYEWFNEKNKEKHKWMPDVFQIIQKIL